MMGIDTQRYLLGQRIMAYLERGRILTTDADLLHLFLEMGKLPLGVPSGQRSQHAWAKLSLKQIEELLSAVAFARNPKVIETFEQKDPTPLGVHKGEHQRKDVIKF